MDATSYKESKDPQEELIQMWKIKRMINNLEEMSGSGTSMISLYVPPKRDGLNQAAKQLVDQEGSAANIKSSINKAQVIGGITSLRQKLKLYKQVPTNGLVIFCGTVDQNGKDSGKRFTIDMEPIKPISTSMYHCDSKFMLGPLKEMLVSEEKFGFIIIDGNGTVFATLQGNNKEILQEIHVMLPKKHGRGGQSAPRFGRIRLEKRLQYLKKVGELASRHFITDNAINVKGLILGGSANFKGELEKSEILDERLQKKVLSLVDISYGGENGLNEAIQLSAGVLSNVKFLAEKDLLSKFYSEIAQGTEMICFGPLDTIFSLENGAVEQLVIYEDLDYMRVEVMHPVTKETKILYLKKDQLDNPKHFLQDGIELEIVDNETPLIEWLIDNYQNYGATLEFVSDKSQEGFQFVEGFGGIGGFLRYKLDVDIDEATKIGDI